MKNRNLKLLTLIICVSLFLVNCREEQPLSIQPEIENFDKMNRFLSITLQVDQSRIQYDKVLKEFFIPNTIYRESLKSVQDRYNSSNVYKLQYE